MTPVWIKILITVFAGVFMAATVIRMGRQMLMFLSEVLGEEKTDKEKTD